MNVLDVHKYQALVWDASAPFLFSGTALACAVILIYISCLAQGAAEALRAILVPLRYLSVGEDAF